MNNQKYYIGLDIGTNAVGWAVTEPSYKLKKANGKDLWGVRMFEAAQTCEDYRASRVARRRLERRKQRIDWLQLVFNREISKVDVAFYQRLEESKFQEEDKRGDRPLGRFSLFNDPGFTDKEYHKVYPTIYHLRKALMDSKEPFDVRLVYLAVHHILKYRGHFLYGDLSLDSVTFDACMSKLTEHLQNEYEVTFPIGDPQKFAAVLTDKKLNITEKKKSLLKITGIQSKNKQLSAVLDALVGKTTSLNVLFGDAVTFEGTEKLCLADDFETIEGKLTELLGDHIELVLLIKGVYDWALLENIRGNSGDCKKRYLSDIKIESYEKHKADLKLLKKILNDIEDEEIRDSLRKEVLNDLGPDSENYAAYVGNSQGKRAGYDKFAAFLSKKLKKLEPKTEEIETILSELDRGEFLPLQRSTDNRIIPYQLHMEELNLILENASTYLPFLNETDESGLSRKEQIIEMFKFQIPYYVGPLNTSSPRSWLVRSNKKIFPWNFNRVVNKEKTAERFITRMTAKCTYIGEDVIPKNSLLYSKYMVLNELNVLKINGKNISVKTKQGIYNNLFMTGKKVTGKKLISYLRSIGEFEDGDRISGIDGDFKSTLYSHKVFAWLLDREKGEAMAEDIIRHIVLFGDDRKLLESWLKSAYGDKLTSAEQKSVLSLKFSGWGKMSREFLTEIYHVDEETGEAMNIMDGLWNTNNNLMQLLSSEFNFREAVADYRKSKFAAEKPTLKKYLDDSYAPSGIRRAIYQAMALIDEIERIMKCRPSRVFVNVAREPEERTAFRYTKENLDKIFESCGEEGAQLREELKNFSDSDLRQDKLYLYFLQMGRCMYSGKKIDIKLLETNLYDIDHIYPKSLTRDDSLGNRVLVSRSINEKKSDHYPIDREIQENCAALWDKLKEKGLMTSHKYNRLIRTTALTDAELERFISHKVVETSHSSKLIAELLQQKFGSRCEVVYVKAGNVSAFRQDQRISEDGTQKMSGMCDKDEITRQDPLFVRCREVNEFYHAKDAYLNIVVGNVYHVKFTKSPANYIKELRNNLEKKRRYSLNRVFDFNVERDGEQAWTAGQDGSIVMVRRTMRRNNILFTRLSREVKGALFDLQIVPKGKAQAPIKTSDPRMTVEKFGGYNKRAGAYFFLVEHNEKGKRIRSLEPVFLMYKNLYENDPMTYCKTILPEPLVDPRILIPRIKVDSLVSVNGFRMQISGRSGNSISYKNANQIIIAPQWHVYIKGLVKYLTRCKKAKKDIPITEYDHITLEENLALYDVLLQKLNSSLYCERFGTIISTLTDCKNKYELLDLADQCRVLVQILRLFDNSPNGVDLSLLCGKKAVGIISLSKKLKNNNYKLIHQSITGVFEQEIDLLSPSF